MGHYQIVMWNQFVVSMESGLEGRNNIAEKPPNSLGNLVSQWSPA